MNTTADHLENEDTQKDKYLTFFIGSEVYGIDIRYVTEIIGIQPITEVPGLADYVRGIINLRGKIIPVMDVRLRFKKAFREYNDRTCIIVVDILDMPVGIIVDSVAEVIVIPEEEIVPPPGTVHGDENKYVRGIGKTGNDVKLLLDCCKLIDSGEHDSILERIG